MDDKSVITVKPTDDLIDLSPCIGIYQEAVFFNQDQYDIDKEIDLYFSTHKDLKKDKEAASLSLDEKILYLVALKTRQERYRKQVAVPFVSGDELRAIIDRLSELFVQNENVQVQCEILFYEVLKNETVYELKFVSELSHDHFLQCACYMVALNKEKGVLWNTRDNTLYEIRIPNKAAFLDAVARAATKRKLDRYYHPDI